MITIDEIILSEILNNIITNTIGYNPNLEDQIIEAIKKEVF